MYDLQGHIFVVKKLVYLGLDHVSSVCCQPPCLRLLASKGLQWRTTALTVPCVNIHPRLIAVNGTDIDICLRN